MTYAGKIRLLTRQCYGQNAIVLTKEWGIAHGVSPVRYIHENSPGADDAYMSTKTMFRIVRETSGGKQAALVMDYLKISLMRDEGILSPSSVPTQLADDPRVAMKDEQLDDEFQELLRRIDKEDALTVTRYLGSLIARIAELHNELESRDSFTRHCSEDFKCPASGRTIANKVLYDEREWRSIKYGTEGAPDDDSEGTPQQWRVDGFLPSRFNLRFTDEDVVAIVTQDVETRARILARIRSGKTQLTPTYDRVHSVESFGDTGLQ